MSEIKLAIADDHELFRETLARYLDQKNSLSVVHKACNGSCLLEQLSESLVDIVLLDLNMPEMDGGTALQRIRKTYGRQVKVIILSFHDQITYLKRLMRAGANAYMDKGCQLDNLLDAIQTVHERGEYYDPKYSKDLIKEIKYGTGDETSALQGEVLTKREIEIVQLLCAGFSCPQIAERIFLSIRTVENHKHNVFKKFGVRSPTAMMEAAIRCGYYQIEM